MIIPSCFKVMFSNHPGAIRHLDCFALLLRLLQVLPLDTAVCLYPFVLRTGSPLFQGPTAWESEDRCVISCISRGVFTHDTELVSAKFNETLIEAIAKASDEVEYSLLESRAVTIKLVGAFPLAWSPLSPPPSCCIVAVCLRFAFGFRTVTTTDIIEFNRPH